MILPSKLKKDDEIRVIAPSNSMSLISKENIKLAKDKIELLGFTVTFSKNCTESDMFISSSVQSRVEDLHDAFLDKNVKGILCVIGGHNANQLLNYIDFNIIKNNPKVFCGYSDITVLQNAIFTKTQLVTYSGLCFSTFAMQKEMKYNIQSFIDCVSKDKEFEIIPSKTYSDDKWYIDQVNRNILPNEGFWIIQKGSTKGIITGGNLCTFNLLQGTKYMPDLTNKILFLEDDYESKAVNFERDLQSLIHQPNFHLIKAIVIGRFQQASEITKEKILYIIKTKKELEHIPIIANVDFGHTNPLVTFPIGGECKINADDENATITITKH